jgi:hypothetical protein
MNILSTSKTDNSLTVVVREDSGKIQAYSTTRTNPRWDGILTALRSGDAATIVNLMSIKNMVEMFTDGNVSIKEGNVFFKNRPLHGLDVDRLLEYVRDNIPYLRLLRFLERKHSNPSYRSINELYKFLEHREMTLTENGTVIGYKGVRDDYYSVMGNTATIMINGQTDSGGHILNKVGESVRCDRSCVCDDYRQGCSPGLHIGSLSYAKGWGPRVMVVEFDPADVVSVPDDSECQKLRACAYKVIGEYSGSLVTELNPLANEERDNGEPEGGGCYDDTEDDTEFVGGPFEDDDSGASDDGVNAYDDAYDDGYELGVKEGKAHKARKHHSTDVDEKGLTAMEVSYIKGYNDGYRAGRYNK